MMGKILNILLLSGILILLFFSCQLGYQAEEDPQTEPVINIINEFWVTDDNGYIQYYTNDRSRLSDKGRTDWSIYDIEVPCNTIEMEALKLSGAGAYGYGAVFCIQDDNTTDYINFYAVLINTEGYFRIVKVVDEVQHRVAIEGSDSNGWKRATDTTGNAILFTGANVSNTIRVEYMGENENEFPVYDIYFNNELGVTHVENFTRDGTDDLNLFHGDINTDKYGFIVTLSPYEYFPYVPVDVRFRYHYAE